MVTVMILSSGLEITQLAMGEYSSRREHGLGEISKAPEINTSAASTTWNQHANPPKNAGEKITARTILPLGRPTGDRDPQS
jgi:hypothetical protein